MFSVERMCDFRYPVQVEFVHQYQTDDLCASFVGKWKVLLPGFSETTPTKKCTSCTMASIAVSGLAIEKHFKSIYEDLEGFRRWKQQKEGEESSDALIETVVVKVVEVL